MSFDGSTVCRLCLANVAKESISIQPYIGTLCGLGLLLQFSLDDRMPQQICQHCVEQVESAELLRRRIFQVESLWSRHIPTAAKQDTTDVLFTCHLCGFLCTYQNLPGHVPMCHGADHLEDCRLCQLTVASPAEDMTNIDPPLEAEPQPQYFEFIDVRGGVEEPQEAQEIENLDISIKLEPPEEFESDLSYPESPPAPPELPLDNSRQVTCPICLRVYSNPILLRKHIRTIHKEQTACLKCFRNFASPAEVAVHQPLCRYTKCSICRQGFADGQAYSAHLASVHQKEALRCPHKGCDKVLLDRTCLRSHTLTHSTEKRYKCRFEGCSAAFHQNAVLKTHERAKHTGERPFECVHCHRRFAAPGNHLLHQKGCQKMQQQQMERKRRTQSQKK